MDNGSNLSASEIFTIRIKYKLFSFLPDIGCANVFLRTFFLFILFSPPTGVLSVKAQRVSALRGGSAKYI